MSAANQEQLKAIEHTGGVLLKAGAGSGKTFVLKEHIIYLTQKWINEYERKKTLEDFEQFIKAKFTKVVLMTFTKKAAGELSIRLTKEFSQKSLDVDSTQRFFWEQATNQLDYLTVTTIHGFCFKLIKQGFFSDVDLEDDIINSAEYNQKMQEIFDQWLEAELMSNDDREFIDLIIKDKNAISDSIKSIFLDPSLRKMWSQNIDNKITFENTNQTILELVSILQLDSFLAFGSDVKQHEEFSGKPWYEFIKSFNEIQRPIRTLEDIIHYDNFFINLNYKMPMTPRAKAVTEEMKCYYIAIKELKDFLKANGEDLQMFYKHNNGLVKNWYEKFCNIIKYIETEYKSSPGITFSDLEYVVARGVEKPEISETIGKTYDYIIIDEFQDTSQIQFDIISNIIGADFTRLFCVGDIKQAIYGFRGGELGVFLNCETVIPQVLSLKNNYRSDCDIIEFNNNFFDFLFSKGLKYQGKDPNPVEVEYQTAPDELRDKGKIYQINAHCDFLAEHGVDKVSSNEMDYLEALCLLKNIVRLRNEDNENIAILYKKLKPSLLLINLLIENDIGFTAQVKIPYGQDPIIGMFVALLEYDFNSNKLRKGYLELILKSYLNLIDCSLEIDYEKDVVSFQKRSNYFGLYIAFFQFLSNIKLANSNYRNNLSYLKSVCDLGKDNKEAILAILYREKSNSYSLDFQYGENARAVTIMTAHASKGLQFPHVLLGGIYTNDKSFPFTALLGKFPMSFKWGETITSKQKYKTPQYMLENVVTKQKEFSEAKRLFYVACTRAEKSVGWVQLDWGKIKRNNQSGSWQSGINVWLDSDFKTNKKIIQKIKNHSCDVNLQDIFSVKFLEKSSNKPPLFHIDNLGLNTKLGTNEVVILPELSVTRLSSVSECPRKFYLQNICKISDEDLKLISGEPVKLPQLDEDTLSAKSFSSNAQRGIRIHDLISQVISSDFAFSKEISQKDINVINWTVDNLTQYRDNYDFISEKMIKFEFFNYMISGIPDLLLLPKESGYIAQVWDYKTGKRSEQKEHSYRFQLMSYAYAVYQTLQYDKKKQIKLVLCYVDEKQVVEKITSFDDVNNYLLEAWCNINSPEKINHNFCHNCVYSNICHK